MERLKLSVISLVFVAAFAFAPAAFAQSAGHWCGSVWSNFPCSGSDYGYSGSYNYGYGSTYSYPSNYPYNNNYYYNYYPYYPTYYQQTPTCSITYSTGGNYSYGSGYPITLSWSSQNATSAFLSSQTGSVPLSGSMTVYPNGIGGYGYGGITYTLTVSGPGGTRSCSTTYNPSYYNNQNYYSPYTYYPNNYNYYTYGYPYNYSYGYPYSY